MHEKKPKLISNAIQTNTPCAAEKLFLGKWRDYRYPADPAEHWIVIIIALKEIGFTLWRTKAHFALAPSIHIATGTLANVHTRSNTKAHFSAVQIVPTDYKLLEKKKRQRADRRRADKSSVWFGPQRLAAMWSEGNHSKWEHVTAATPCSACPGGQQQGWNRDSVLKGWELAASAGEEKAADVESSQQISLPAASKRLFLVHLPMTWMPNQLSLESPVATEATTPEFGTQLCWRRKK